MYPPGAGDTGEIMRLLKAVVVSAFVLALVFAATSSSAQTLCEATVDTTADQTIDICDTAADRVVSADKTTNDGTTFVAL
jgi:hypothetical protein